MNLIEILAQAQGGGAMDNLSRQFGLDATQTKSAVEQLAPMIAAGFRRNAGNEQGLVDLMQALQGATTTNITTTPGLSAGPTPSTTAMASSATSSVPRTSAARSPARPPARPASVPASSNRCCRSLPA